MTPLNIMYCYHPCSSTINQYVRRELRALTEEDREIFFNTLEIIHRVTTDEGVTTYGHKYKVRNRSFCFSIQYFMYPFFS